MRKPCKACEARRKWIAEQAKKLGRPVTGAVRKLMPKGKGK